MGPATVYVRIGTPIPSSSHTLESLKAEVVRQIEKLQRDLPIPLTVPRAETVVVEEEARQGGREGGVIRGQGGRGGSFDRAQPSPQ